MRNYLLVMLLLACKPGIGQQTVNRPEKAGKYLDAKSIDYNPAKGYTLLKQSAERGDSSAMNGLGILYANGIGVDSSGAEAIKWFTKAAEKGYAKAWYNLGLAYKYGLGTPQDFVKSYESFSRGAALHSSMNIYSKGFMLYKGLGCTQNYQEAFRLFSAGARMSSLGSCYMLGLCYRNGYGTPVKPDSALFWLQRASTKGYRPALDELMSARPENTSLQKTKLPVASTKRGNGYQVVKQAFNEQGIDGSYSGYVIRYDWSGKHEISKTTLTVKLSQKGKSISGMWVEDGAAPTPIQALLTESSLVFKETEYQKNDHYNQRSPNRFRFNRATLQLTRKGDSILLAGNLQLFSTKLSEPEKPMYITLVRTETSPAYQASTAADDLLSLAVKPTPKTSAPFLAYPNPFNNSIQVDFTVQQSSKVSIKLVDMLGITKYNGKQETLPVGDYTRTITTPLIRGTYILVLAVNGQSRSITVIKE